MPSLGTWASTEEEIKQSRGQSHDLCFSSCLLASSHLGLPQWWIITCNIKHTLIGFDQCVITATKSKQGQMETLRANHTVTLGHQCSSCRASLSGTSAECFVLRTRGQHSQVVTLAPREVKESFMRTGNEAWALKNEWWHLGQKERQLHT